MANIGQLATLLETIPGITVFSDGKIYEGCMRDRTFYKTPFIQLIEEGTDTSDHVGGGQNAVYTIRGKYTYKREISNNVRAHNDLISVLKTNNLFQVKVDGSRDVSAELIEVDFVVTCWDAITA